MKLPPISNAPYQQDRPPLWSVIALVVLGVLQ